MRCWHPYTQMSFHASDPPLRVERAEGLFLFDADGNRYYDAISSWWCVVHGHGHPRIREAAVRQMERLDHVLFAGVTHEPAELLSERLVSLAPEGLSRVFFSDNGSTAVEVALKMSLQYWRNVGRPEKTQFVCLDLGYHGDTTGCMSVSGVEAFLRSFRRSFSRAARPGPVLLPLPRGKGIPRLRDRVRPGDGKGAGGRGGADRRGDPRAAAHGRGRDDRLSSIVSRGSRAPGPRARRAPDRRRGGDGVRPHGDDVRLRAGRGHARFPVPFEGAHLRNDALRRDDHHRPVYDAFLGDPDSGRTFYHGHTYTANPIGCAVALASLDLFGENAVLDTCRPSPRAWGRRPAPSRTFRP